MPPPPRAGVVHLDVSLGPHELAGAWRAETRSLLLPTHEPLRLQQRVSVQITVVGRGVGATITGRVVSASRHEDHHRIELMPDEIRTRALERLLAVARGEVVEYQVREPRFLVSMPAVVAGPTAGATYMSTFSISEKGCGLVWSGDVPAVGVPVEVRLGAGNRAAAFRSEVAWTARSWRAVTVGLRFLAGPRGAWALVLADARRSGAPIG